MENDEIEKRLKKLEKENRRLKKEVKSQKKFGDILSDDNRQISRRDFLKKAGLGVAGLGALSLSPAASQLKLTKNGIQNASSINTNEISINNVGAKGVLTSTQDIPSGSSTRIELDSATGEGFEDNSDLIEVDTTNNKLILKKSGKYTLVGGVKFAEDLSSGDRYILYIEVGGTTVGEVETSTGTAQNPATTVMAQKEVTSPNRDVTLKVFHNNSSARQIIGDDRVFLSAIFNG